MHALTFHLRNTHLIQTSKTSKTDVFIPVIVSKKFYDHLKVCPNVIRKKLAEPARQDAENLSLTSIEQLYLFYNQNYILIILDLPVSTFSIDSFNKPLDA